MPDTIMTENTNDEKFRETYVNLKSNDDEIELPNDINSNNASNTPSSIVTPKNDLSNLNNFVESENKNSAVPSKKRIAEKYNVQRK